MKKIEDLINEIENLVAEFQDATIGIADWERKEIWDEDYKTDYKKLKNELAELKEELEKL